MEHHAVEPLVSVASSRRSATFARTDLRFPCDQQLAAGYEGVCGFVTTVLILLIAYWLYGSTPAGRGGYFDAVQGAKDIVNNRNVWTSSIVIACSIALFNFCGLAVTRSVSATARSTIDSCRTLLIWAVSLLLGWEHFNPLQIVGCALAPLRSLSAVASDTDRNHTPLQLCIPRLRHHDLQRGDLLPPLDRLAPRRAPRRAAPHCAVDRPARRGRRGRAGQPCRGRGRPDEAVSLAVEGTRSSGSGSGRRRGREGPTAFEQSLKYAHSFFLSHVPSLYLFSTSRLQQSFDTVSDSSAGDAHGRRKTNREAMIVVKESVIPEECGWY